MSNDDTLRTRIAAALKAALAEQVYTVTINDTEPYSIVIDGDVDLLDTADMLIHDIPELQELDDPYERKAEQAKREWADDE